MAVELTPGAGLFTVCVIAELALELKLESPEYVAVILWVPAPSVDVESVAVLAAKVPVPRIVAPSKNVTVPVLVPDAGDTGDTVAVNDTDWPESDGFAFDDMVVVVPPLLTVCVIAGLVLGSKLESPEYTAVMLCVPVASVDVNEATPLASVPEPILLRPSRNVTVPVGVPPDPVTVAVNVTVWPTTDGLMLDDTTVELATGVGAGSTSSVAAKVFKYDEVVSHGFGRLSSVR